MTKDAYTLKATPDPDQFVVIRKGGGYIGNIHRHPFGKHEGKWAATVRGVQQFDRRFFNTAHEAATALTEL